MTRLRAVVALAALLLAATVPAVRADLFPVGDSARHGTVYAHWDGTTVRLGNDLVERVWRRSSFTTEFVRDKRGIAHNWAGVEDFTLDLGGASLPGSAMSVTSVVAQPVSGGLRVRLGMGVPGGAVTVERVVEAYDGIAGFRTHTTVRSVAPLTVTGAHLESLGGAGLTPTVSAFRAGADWREPGWEGPDLSVGDPHAGTWRDSRSAPAGTPLAGAAQHVSVSAPDGRRGFVMLERNDFPSSRAAFDGRAASVLVDYSADVLSLGPLEENGHVENPAAGTASAGRSRVVRPGAGLTFEATFAGFGTDADDEAWQLYKYLDLRMPDYEKDATFNTNGTDSNRISTGAKDDVDFATLKQIAPLAKRMGISTFILDDGWQAISGDWEPDSPEFPEPRSPYNTMPRFPDASFAAVRQEIAPMKLGLWMSPTFFNPASSAYKAHPEWVCSPIGHGLAAYNTVEPNSSSNEAGLGAWGPDALPYVQTRIERAITEWDVSYFKFDFLAWFDCAGQGDLYDFKERFVAMLDAVQAKHPHVTLQIDETNDYRLFPFESVVRGPSWFQNGSPSVRNLLHNVWNLAPWIPSYSLGQHFLGDYRGVDMREVDLRMAASLLSHPTFFSDPRRYDVSALDRAGEWLAFRREHLAAFTGMTFPLLADPVAGGWTALQSWDVDAATGSLSVFRQAASASSVRVALRGLGGVPADRLYELVSAPSGQVAGVVTAGQLRAGIDVVVEQPGGFQVMVVRPAG